MKVIMGGRKSGRTSLLIHEAAIARKRGEICYIVCHSRTEAQRIAQRAAEMNLVIGFPITYEEVLSSKIRHSPNISFLIDNADRLLQSLTEVPIKVITMEKEIDQDDGA